MRERKQAESALKELTQDLKGRVESRTTEI
jgi:hypothetical protein